MSARKAGYTVAELAELAGVSVRTLHHYDRIGLLAPGSRTAAGYRMYGWDELRKLQQILFFRELDVPLEEIRRIVERPDFDPAAALRTHRRLLVEKAERLARLVATVDRTIAEYAEERTMLTDEELYEGFPKETVERWKREAKAKYGAAYEESDRKARSMSKDEAKAVFAEGGELERRWADLARSGAPHDGEAAMELAAAWRDHMSRFWEPGAEAFAGLGRMYCENEEFRARYEAMQKGLAEFMRDAMAAFARTRM